MKKEPLFDVIIYDIESGKVASIIGSRMRRSKGFTNAERRLDTAFERINDSYSAKIVPTGKFKVGDIVP